ncbi:MAG: hypothetical protein M5U28_43350 [Sandaracinaceae bacterium]|nr:hypothetical protein [Sandaracinaceae bacterium]
MDDAAQRKVRDAMRSRVDLWRRQGRWAAELASVEGAESDTLARFVRIRSAIAVTGRFDDADRRYVERALAGAAEGSRYQLALMQFLVEMLAGARAYDDALALAERAVDAGLLDLVWLERCPLLTEVSDDERYRRLHERMKARVAETLRVSAS